MHASTMQRSLALLVGQSTLQHCLQRVLAGYLSLGSQPAY